MYICMYEYIHTYVRRPSVLCRVGVTLAYQVYPTASRETREQGVGQLSWAQVFNYDARSSVCKLLVGSIRLQASCLLDELPVSTVNEMRPYHTPPS